MLSADEKQLIKKVSKTQISMLVVLVEIPLDSQAAQEINTSITEVKAWLQSHSPVQPLLLPFYLNVQENAVDSSFQRELDMFCKSLETLVKRKPEDILAKRLTAQVLSQLALIENFLNKREKALERENQQDEAKLQRVGGEDLRRQIDRTFRQVNEEKVEIFKQIKAKVSNSKDDLLYEYLTPSIPCKIRKMVGKLKLDVTKQEDGVKYIKLVDEPRGPQRRKSKLKIAKEKTVVNANTLLMDLCRSELSQWATKEWKQICTLYVEGGLRGFFQRSYGTLNSIPVLNLSNLPLQPRNNINIQQIFEEPFEEPPCEAPYPDVSPLSYFFKKVRTQWMQFLFIFSFLSILGFGGRRQIFRWIIQPISEAFEREFWLSMTILVVILYFLLKYLVRAYRKYRDLEQEKAVEKLRNNLCSYYQSLVKNRLVEKIMQNLMLALEVEEQRLEAIIQAVKHLAEQINKEAENNQLPIKMQMNRRKEQQNSLKRDLGDLLKLKRI